MSESGMSNDLSTAASTVFFAVSAELAPLSAEGHKRQ
jgi:hypothetical protein